MRKLQIGDKVKVTRDDTGELKGCVGEVLYLDEDEDEIQKVNYTIGVPYVSVAVSFGKADNTTLLNEEDVLVHNAEPKWGAWFRRNELRYSPKLNLSPIRCVPEKCKPTSPRVNL